MDHYSQNVGDVGSFVRYLDATWQERRSNWNSSGDVFSMLTRYFNESHNPYLSFLELVDVLPDQADDSPNTLHNCVWKHFCTWVDQKFKHHGHNHHNNHQHGHLHHHSHSHHGRGHFNPHHHGNHQASWIHQRTRFLTRDVLIIAAEVSLKNELKNFTTVCSLFRFTDQNPENIQGVIEIFSRAIQQLVEVSNYQGVILMFDHLINIIEPGPLLNDQTLNRLILYLICTNEGATVRKILTNVSPTQRVYSVISFIDSIVGAATSIEQDQMVRRELEKVVRKGDKCFSTQSMYTIATKLAKDLGVPCKYYPNMTFIQLKGTAKFITSATFGAEAEMDMDTFREAIQDLAEIDDRFPQFVVKYLIQIGYYDEAYYFAQKFHLNDILESSTFANWTPNDEKSNDAAIPWLNDNEIWPMESYCYELPLSNEAIIFVDTVGKYRTAFKHILSLPDDFRADHLHRSVGIDTEWTPVHRPDKKQAISILQLALIDRVYIMDVENLSPKLTNDDWQMMDDFFKSQDIKKLSYAFKSDLSMLKTSFPEAANFDLTKIVSHVDLERLTHQVWKALRAIDCGPISICNDAVVLDATSTAIPTSLADVARSFLGRRVTKMFRLSNWSRRPLCSGQLQYAAVDAYCLLEIYREISQVIALQRLKVSPEISVLRKGDVVVNSDSPEMPPNKATDIRLLVDAFLTDVGDYLKQLGFDVATASDKCTPAEMLKRAVAENRAVVTVPHLVTNYTNAETSVVGVPFGTLQEQADFVAHRFNVQVNFEDNKPIAPFVPVQRLQQIAGRRKEEAVYDIISDPTRPPHDPMFTAKCTLISSLTCDVTLEAQAVATNKKEAKKRAAANMIVKLTAVDQNGVISTSTTAPRSAREVTTSQSPYNYGQNTCNNNGNYHFQQPQHGHYRPQRGGFAGGNNSRHRREMTQQQQQDYWCS